MFWQRPESGQILINTKESMEKNKPRSGSGTVPTVPLPLRGLFVHLLSTVLGLCSMTWQPVYYINKLTDSEIHIQKAQICRSHISRPSTTLQPVISLKRKTGYNEKEDEETMKARKKFQQMYMDTESN